MRIRFRKPSHYAKMQEKSIENRALDFLQLLILCISSVDVSVLRKNSRTIPCFLLPMLDFEYFRALSLLCCLDPALPHLTCSLCQRRSSIRCGRQMRMPSRVFSSFISERSRQRLHYSVLMKMFADVFADRAVRDP